MKLFGKIIVGTKLTKSAVVEEEDENLPYRDRLEKCLVDLCREIEIPVPIWMKKNTTEFVRFRQTFFTKDQFVEKINFDRFEIKVE